MEPIVFVLIVIIAVLIAVQVWLLRVLREGEPQHPPPSSAEPALLRTVLDISPDALFVIDRNGRYVFSNHAHYTSLRASAAEQVIGRTIDEFFPPDIAAHIQREDDTVRQTRSMLQVETPDPSAPERWLQIVKIPTLAADGSVETISATVRDITSVKRAQDALQLRVSQMQLLSHIDHEIGSTLDIDRVAMFALDMLMRISVADAGFIAVLDSDTETLEVVAVIGHYQRLAPGMHLSLYQGVTGRAVFDQQPIRLLDAPADPDYDACIATTRALMLIPLISQDQLVGIVRLEIARPERFSDEFYQFAQLVAGRIAIAMDNARLYKVVQAQLESVSRLEQLKTDMIRIASHDLKNPLAIIQGYLALVEMDAHKFSAETLDIFADIRRAAERMHKILTDILSLERVNERAQGNFSPVNLSLLVAAAVEEFQPQAAAHQQTLSLTLPDSAVIVPGDEAQLYEAIANLLSNALKYTPDGGSIDVTLETEGSEAALRVRDTGYGIPHEMQARLFQPFYRARTEETYSIEGTGLGLHLVHNIIDRHRGCIIFHSAYGQGSTFGFRLPLHEPVPQPVSGR